MKRRIFPAGLLLAITVLFCAALYWNGDYVVYMLTYIFSFAFLLCYTILTCSAIKETVIQIIIYTLILAAQILFSVLVIRSVAGTWQNIALCRLLGVLIIFLPFLIRQIRRSHI